VYVRGAAQAERRAAQAKRKRERAEADLVRQHDRSRKQQERDAKLAAITDAKARQQAYFENRQLEADELNQELAGQHEELRAILSSAVGQPWGVDFESLKQRVELPAFDPSDVARPVREPALEAFLPHPPGPLARFLGSPQQQSAERVEEAKRKHQASLAEHRSREEKRLVRLAELQRDHEETCSKVRADVAGHNREVDAFREAYEAADAQAVSRYFAMALEDDELPEGFPPRADVAFVPESHQLIVERDLPTIDAIPTVTAHRYIKARNKIEHVARHTREVGQHYEDVIAQLALRTLHIVLSADKGRVVDTVVWNGFVPTIEPATGKDIRPCVLSLRASRQSLEGLELTKLDPAAAVKRLNARVSRSASELLPVKPIVDFNMVDKRFIESTDVLSGLEERPNLMELSPGDFEALITNLFQKLGLETKLTQASRDGGVDCVAWDMRPVVGGKVIVQAKRYKHTVGVSAVRDLYGTVHNEGATKGILVTTSGYGAAAYDFANNKPLQLVTGAELLYMLEEQAGITARIEVPADWTDPVPDSGDEPRGQSGTPH
jgi:restriction system protein